MLVGKGILKRLQPFHRFSDLLSLLATKDQETQAERCLGSIKLVVIDLVCTDLCVEVLEPARDPGGVPGLIVIGEKVAGPVAQEPGELPIINLRPISRNSASRARLRRTSFCPPRS